MRKPFILNILYFFIYVGSVILTTEEKVGPNPAFSPIAIIRQSGFEGARLPAFGCITENENLL